MIYNMMKRMIDIVIALCILCILSPVFLIICLLIKCDSKGPIFFKQKRIKKHKKVFTITKFRTMKCDCPANMSKERLQNASHYITQVGGLLRKTSLDELPQLFHVIVGDMSLVGPRPCLVNQRELLYFRDLYGANDVPVGLTGWAQINGRDTLSDAEKAGYDGDYVNRRSVIFDLRCLVQTIPVVLFRHHLVDGETQ